MPLSDIAGRWDRLNEDKHMSDRFHSALTAEERAALNAFVNAVGRSWKQELTEVYWYNARIWSDPEGDMTHGYVLHSLRNRPGGHEALEDFIPH